MERVLIYGAGRHAEVIAHLMRKFNLHDVVGFTVKREYLDKTELNGCPVFPYEDLEESHPPKKFKMFIAIGPQYVNRAREDIFQDAKKRGYRFVNCICPSPNIAEDIVLGENVYIDHFSMISNFVEIGSNTIIMASIIGHHCKINNNCFISSSVVAGNVRVEKNVFIGINSSIGPNICLGENTVIGMGCAISKSTDPNSVYLNQTTKKQAFDSSKLKLL